MALMGKPDKAYKRVADVCKMGYKVRDQIKVVRSRTKVVKSQD